MAERITGTEMEYPVSVRVNTEDGSHGPDLPINSYQLAEVYKWCIPAGLTVVRTFATNGARMYIDMNNWPEYATPEDGHIAEGTVANEIIGERIQEEMFRAAAVEPRFSPNTRFDKAVVHKRVVGLNGDPKFAWGYHENYRANRKNITFDAEGLTLLGLHLATRNVYAGGGSIRQRKPGEPYEFYLAQKAMSVDIDFSATTTTRKPLVHTKDEPHADKEKYARIHVVCGDPHMSPWAIRMQLGPTSLVARLMEQGVKLDHLRLPPDQMHRMGHLVATDLTMRQTVTLANGKTIRPVEIQGEIYENALKLEREGFDDDDRWTVVEWERALTDIEDDPMLLKNRADWALMKHLLDGKYADDPDFVNTRYNSLDSSRLDPKHPAGLSSLGLYFRQNLWKQYMPDVALIEDRRYNPPETIAKLRTQVVEMLASLHVSPNAYMLNWNFLQLERTFPGQADQEVFLFEPGATELPDDLLKKLQSAGAVFSS